MPDNPLDTFARDAEPSPRLRHRVEESLRRRGHLKRRTSSWRHVGIAASLLLAAGVGFAAGRVRPEGRDAHEERQYLLLLREDSSYHDDRPVGDIVQEYSGWADSLRRHDLLIIAEKLGDEYASVASGAAASSPAVLESPTTGFFLVRASSLEAAKAIAAASPHVKYGGRIVVRSIE